MTSTKKTEIILHSLKFRLQKNKMIESAFNIFCYFKSNRWKFCLNACFQKYCFIFIKMRQIK